LYSYPTLPLGRPFGFVEVTPLSGAAGTPQGQFSPPTEVILFLVNYHSKRWSANSKEPHLDECHVCGPYSSGTTLPRRSALERGRIVGGACVASSLTHRAVSRLYASSASSMSIHKTLIALHEKILLSTFQIHMLKDIMNVSCDYYRRRLSI
jgi:hypothetical protein